MAKFLAGEWQGRGGIGLRRYRCGHCGERVASELGWQTVGQPAPSQVRTCPNCNYPTYFDADGKQLPAATDAGDIQHLPSDVEALYSEARRCKANNAYTACVLALRKLLMHVAVEKGAKPGLSFVEYVEYLDREQYLGRDGKGWVDRIRTKGNEANHEIVLMGDSDAEDLLTLSEMLLKLVYEFPGNLKAKKP